MLSAKDIPESLLTPVREALSTENGGEVVVRQGGHCGRIFVCREKIAWVTCSSITKHLREVLVEEAELSEQDLDEALRESKQTGSSFAETLLCWGLLDQATLNHCLLLHNARHFQGIVALGSEMNAMFIPQPIRYSAEYLYSLDEILKASQLLSQSGVSSEEAAVLSKQIEATAQMIPGARLIAIARGQNCQVIGQWSADKVKETLSLKGIWNELIHNKNVQQFGKALSEASSNNETEVVFLSDDSVILVRSLGKEHFAIIQCHGLDNMGMILRRSRAGFDELLKTIEL